VGERAKQENDNDDKHEFLNKGPQVVKRRSTTQRVKQQREGRNSPNYPRTSPTFSSVATTFRSSEPVSLIRKLALQAIEHMIEREPAPSSFRAQARAGRGRGRLGLAAERTARGVVVVVAGFGFVAWAAGRRRLVGRRRSLGGRRCLTC
jgi:hypothetical protein